MHMSLTYQNGELKNVRFTDRPVDQPKHMLLEVGTRILFKQKLMIVSEPEQFIAVRMS